MAQYGISAFGYIHIYIYHNLCILLSLSCMLCEIVLVDLDNIDKGNKGNILEGVK